MLPSPSKRLRRNPAPSRKLRRTPLSSGWLRRNALKNFQRQQALHSSNLRRSARSNSLRWILPLSSSRWFRTCLSECEIGTGSTRNFSRNALHRFSTRTTLCGENSVRNSLSPTTKKWITYWAWVGSHHSQSRSLNGSEHQRQHGNNLVRL